MTNILSGVVTEVGTGTSAAIDGFARSPARPERPGRFSPIATERLATANPGTADMWLLLPGYVPADNPEISMVIVVDEPQGAFYASAVAAPVFSQVGHYALRILGCTARTDPSPRPDTKVRAQPALGPEATVA